MSLGTAFSKKWSCGRGPRCGAYNTAKLDLRAASGEGKGSGIGKRGQKTPLSKFLVTTLAHSRGLAVWRKASAAQQF